jgi:hypothetical protein
MHLDQIKVTKKVCRLNVKVIVNSKIVNEYNLWILVAKVKVKVTWPQKMKNEKGTE